MTKKQEQKQEQEQEQTSSWEEPVSFDTFIKPPFPIDKLPTILSAMASSVSDVTQTSIDAAGVAILAMVSTAIMKKCYIRLTAGEGGWEEKNNLYTVIVMPPAERKSAIFNHLVKPIMAYERAIQHEQYAPSEGRSQPQRYRRLMTDDATPQALAELLEDNNERMSILTTEPGLFDMLSNKHHGKPMNLDVHLKSFTGDRIIIDRKNGHPIIIEEPSLTICMFAQPDALQGLPKRLTGRGLLGRFLYSIPEPRRGQRDITLKSVPKELSEHYINTIRRLLEFNPHSSIPLTLSTEAFEVFQKYRSKFEPKLGEGGDLSYEFLSSWTERLPGQLLRIAALFHMVVEAEKGAIDQDSLPRTIPPEAMEHALAFSDYFLEHAKQALGCIKKDDSMEDAEYLLEKLRTEGTYLYKRQILWSKVKGKFAKAERLDEALEVLRSRGYIRIKVMKAQRGRNGEEIECHPSIVSEV